MAILFPIIVVLLLAGTQTAVWFYARQTAQAAAQAGARAASTAGAVPGAGTAAAAEFLRSAGGDLSDTKTSEDTADGEVTVSVSGSAPLVIPLPGLNPSVTASATRPIEQFTVSGGQP